MTNGNRTSSPATPARGLGDYLLMPIAPPKGGSSAASMASATVLGAGAGLAADFAASRFGLNDPYEDPREAKKRRLRRTAYGAAAGLGLSALTNFEARRADAAGSKSWLKRKIVRKGIRPSLRSGAIGSKLVPAGSDIGSRKVSEWRMSDNQLKRVVMEDPALTFQTKRVLFRQIDDATRGRGRSASMDSMIHYGGGAAAGYFSALTSGAGPVQRGISAVVGAMIGGAVLNQKKSDQWSYTPGFKTYT